MTPQPKLPERSDEARYPRGIVWRRNREHETKVLQIRRRECVGEEVL